MATKRNRLSTPSKLRVLVPCWLPYLTRLTSLERLDLWPQGRKKQTVPLSFALEISNHPLPNQIPTISLLTKSRGHFKTQGTQQKAPPPTTSPPPPQPPPPPAPTPPHHHHHSRPSAIPSPQRLSPSAARHSSDACAPHSKAAGRRGAREAMRSVGAKRSVDFHGRKKYRHPFFGKG